MDSISLVILKISENVLGLLESNHLDFDAVFITCIVLRNQLMRRMTKSVSLRMKANLYDHGA